MAHAQTAETNKLTVATAGLICFVAGGLYGWSALIGPLQDTFQISVAQTGFAFSLAIVSFTCAVLALPMVLGNCASLRQLSGLSLFGAVCALVAMIAPGYTWFLLSFSIGFGAASGGIYIVALGIAVQASRHQLATASMVASFGAGGAVFGPLWRVLDTAGWGMSGLVFLIAGLACGAVLAWLQSGPQVRVSRSRAPIHTSKPFPWVKVTVIWLVFAFGSYSGLMVLGMASKIMDAAGVSVVLASGTLAGIALGNTACRLNVAWLDRLWGLRVCLAVSFIATSSGLLVVLFCQDWAGILSLGLILIAAGYGIIASTAPLITRLSFGPDAFQRRYGVIFTAWGVAGCAAPWLAGALYDLAGSFDLAIVTALAACLAFAATSMVLARSLS